MMLAVSVRMGLASSNGHWDKLLRLKATLKHEEGAGERNGDTLATRA
jgi:hypothetical protein